MLINFDSNRGALGQLLLIPKLGLAEAEEFRGVGCLDQDARFVADDGWRNAEGSPGTVDFRCRLNHVIDPGYQPAQYYRAFNLELWRHSYVPGTVVVERGVGAAVGCGIRSGNDKAGEAAGVGGVGDGHIDQGRSQV